MLYPSRGCHGLLIELKRLYPPGKLSYLQLEMIDRLAGLGYHTEAAWGFDEAKQITEWYLGDVPRVTSQLFGNPQQLVGDDEC